jgi:hydroxymethylbilane synthase
VKPVRIGSRGSMLAAWQAKHIAERLAKLGAATEIIYIKTSGDKFQRAGVNQIGVKGVFIKEIEDALLEKRVDIAVHSMKDLPTETPEGLTFPVICEREDPRDCLVSQGGEAFAQLPKDTRVGTSSLRRQAQLRHARQDLTFMDLRGNVDTRLKKLEQGEYDAIVLAKAGLDRLGWSGKITEVLSADICLPAVGQGALGIEARAEDVAGGSELGAILAKLDHAATRAAVTAERALLRELEGGCQVPLGAWAREDAGEFVMDACIASVDGVDYIRKRAVGDANNAEALGIALARTMLDAGAARILQLAGRNVASSFGS